MASSFNPAKGDICEEDGCEAITEVTYCVKEKKKLCDNCASKRRQKARNGGRELVCDKHDKDMDLYCKTHAVALCYLCAHIDHQQPCDCVDIDDAINEYKTKLNALKEKTNQKMKLCRVHDDGIYKCRLDVDAHLKVVKNEIDSVIDEAIEEDKLRERQDVAKINQEIDEENRKLREQIQKNDEERKKLVEQAHTNAENRRAAVEKKQGNLCADIKEIAEATEREIVGLEQSCQDTTIATQSATRTLDEVLEDDRNVVKDGQRVQTSVANALKKPLDEDRVQRIIGTVSGVRFVRGAGRERYNGRIDGFDGEWRSIGTIDVSLKSMSIVGCIDQGGECQVVISTTDAVHRLSTSSRGMAMFDVSTIKSTHIVNINTEHIQRVIPGSETSWVSSCELLNNDNVVCGKYCKDTSNKAAIACIAVYDRNWNLINDVTIPRQNRRISSSTSVDVAVDQDGMIIAAEDGQSKIYVINPSDGIIINDLSCRKMSKIRGVLSSDHIVAQPWPVDHKLLIINRKGDQREIPYNAGILNVCIDPLTDDLYVLTSDKEYKTCVIDQVMSGSNAVVNRRVASFPLLTRFHEGQKHITSSRVMMTSSGKMMVSDGNKILLYKKFFRC